MTGRSAIVCLTRGYADLRRYSQLIERNRSVYEIINRRRTHQYPLIIWHEGNIPAEHRSYILAQELNADVRFVDISAVFRLPAGLTKRDLMETWSVGYRLMCRFHAYYVWHYAEQFDSVMRLDEDCSLISVTFDPIESLCAAGGQFAAAAFVSESHDLTNQTLAPWATRYAATVFPRTRTARPYNQVFPYTNLYVTHTAFWRQPEVQRFLYAAISERDFICLRWGDLPVLGVALNMFATPDRVYRIPHIRYRHASHNLTLAPAG